ncbi:MAG: hypothetical protein ACFFA2_07855 [Promethearchaeota archaeon]
MSFISGLKGVAKKPVYLFIISSFLAIWILILINNFLLSNFIRDFIFNFGGGLLIFSIVIFILSFFKNIEELKKFLIIIIFGLSLTIAVLFQILVSLALSNLFFIILLYTNLFFTAFFAFKLCMDSATKIDDYIHFTKFRKILRSIEFIIFGFLNWWLFRITNIFFSRVSSELYRIIVLILFIIFLLNLTLIGAVILKLIIKKTFAAYITLFLVLSFGYILYIIFNFLFGEFFSTEARDPLYILGSFFLDLLLFLYMIGVVYDRTIYLKEKLKFMKVDTIALFLIIMKIYVQISKINPRVVIEENLFLQIWGLFIIFIIFTILFGIYSVFTHKPEKESSN